VRFATPVGLRAVIAEDLPPERTVRKVSRVLRTHFNRIREAIIGPDLSTRRLLIDKVLAAEPVREAIADQARRDKSSAAAAWKKAHAMAYEIAAESWWDVLYPANALVNGQWWVMANQCGDELLGKSRVIAPDGRIAAQASRVGQGDDSELLVVSVDLECGIREAERTAGALWADLPGARRPA